ncbi:hypothetical protein [Planobispora takensis]|uniref:Uncharacterized protein n=1 Tax=Planobispora takensis TaxID=1367882 RepID=A0A8J3WWV0_9ACTN|nr:hypothetical protein [Planobispora takensis]GII04208.1 hypothetical protein Pta02_62160 [Planobispora takensis]
MTADNEGWSFASAREPARFAAAEHRRSPEAEHALGADQATLCGIPEAQLDIHRHLFRTDDPRACPRCRQRAAAAPSVACAQERLHDKVLTAAPGALRTWLLNVLRDGAEIGIWISGPADRIAIHAHADRITDGAETVKNLLATHDRIGIARVVQPFGEFIVLLPEHTGPIIAWTTR